MFRKSTSILVLILRVVYIIIIKVNTGWHVHAKLGKFVKNKWNRCGNALITIIIEILVKSNLF